MTKRPAAIARLGMSELQLLRQLREWRCAKPRCGAIHVGPPTEGLDFRLCPKCGSISERTRDLVDLRLTKGRTA